MDGTETTIEQQETVTRLERRLGLFDAVTIGVGGMIGGAIFVAISVATEETGPSVPLSFAFCAFLALLTGYSYAKMAPKFPEAGGGFSYIRRAFKKRKLSLSIGYTVWFAYVAACALYIVGFAGYAHTFINLPKYALAFLIIVPFTGLNIIGLRESALTQNIVVSAKILILAVLVVIGFFYIDPQNFENPFPFGVSAIFIASAAIFIGYQGFDIIANTAEEIKDPDKNISKAIYISIALVSVIYISVSLVAIGTVGDQGVIEDPEAPLSKVAEGFMGSWGAKLLGIGGLLSTASAYNAALYGASRISFTLSRYHLMPKQMVWLTEKSIPMNAILLASSVSAALGIYGIWSAQGLERVASLSSATFLIVFFLVALANHKLRKTTGANSNIIFLTLAMYIVMMISSIFFDFRTWILLVGFIILIYVLDILMRRFFIPWFYFEKEDFSNK